MAEDAGKFVLFWDMRNGQNAILLAAVGRYWPNDGLAYDPLHG